MDRGNPVIVMVWAVLVLLFILACYGIEKLLGYFMRFHKSRLEHPERIQVERRKWK